MSGVEKIIRLLDQAGKVLAEGKFSEYDLKFIKEVLERFLKATNNVLDKIKEE